MSPGAGGVTGLRTPALREGRFRVLTAFKLSASECLLARRERTAGDGQGVTQGKAGGTLLAPCGAPRLQKTWRKCPLPPPMGCRGPSGSPASPSGGWGRMGAWLHCRMSHERGIGCLPTSPRLRAGKSNRASRAPPPPCHVCLSVLSKHLKPGGWSQAAVGKLGLASPVHTSAGHTGILLKVTTLEATRRTPRGAKTPSSPPLGLSCHSWSCSTPP